jgi:hypothetical protein
VQFGTPAGNEPVDAYRTLQLMPSAPHDLVEQAYWVLVGRARARGSNSSRLGDLNDAYATLINPERRGVYDAEHNLAKLRSRPKFEMPKRPMFSRTPKFTTRLTHYQVLDIDFEALPEVVDTAYVFHKAQLRRSDPRTVFVRKLLEDAYATLSNPQSRAAYDDKVAPRHRKLDAALAASVVAAPEPTPPAPLFPAKVEEPVPAVPEHLMAEPSAHAPEAPVSVAAPVASPTPEPRAPRQPGAINRWMKRVTESRQRSHKEQPAREHKPSREERDEAQRSVISAEQKRLSDLGMLAERLPDQPPRPLVGRVRFRFVDGPQAGQTIGLTENSLILGASDAADVVLENPDGSIGAGHIRVWRREDEYILHQLDSFSTTYVNGERLDLRLAILERGDEIRVGPHTLIFDEVPVEETAQA